VPSSDRAVPGADHVAVDVPSEESVAALFGGLGGPPWAVLNTIGGFAAASVMSELDLGESLDGSSSSMSAGRPSSRSTRYER